MGRYALIFAVLCACETAERRVAPPTSKPIMRDAASADSMVNQTTDGRTFMPDAQMTRPDATTIDAGSVIDSGFYADAQIIADASVPPPTGLPQFAFPLHVDDRNMINAQSVFGVDHDPVVYSGVNRYICRNYEDRGFPWCYDEHRGSDYSLTNGFAAMDAGSARVIAAAGGVVDEIEDGNYDRCHADIATGDVSCDGYPMRANYVVLRHAGGWKTFYLHLKQASILVQVGDRVNCGEVLGLVGSSGYSSAPHLHFGVEDAQNDPWDPYAGMLSQPETLWELQDQGDGLPGQMCNASWSMPP